MGVSGLSHKNPNFQLPFNGGWKLPSGQSTVTYVPTDFYHARYWGRTGCKTVNGVFKCETGDCGTGRVECGWDGRKDRWALRDQPTTLAEFALNTDFLSLDFYDLSLVDGFNIPMTIIPQNPVTAAGDKYKCGTPRCVTDILSKCLSELQIKNSNGQTVACQNACVKYNTDNYCCQNVYIDRAKCNKSVWPFDYPGYFKNMCPDAYSFPYDDATSIYACKNTGYIVQFC